MELTVLSAKELGKTLKVTVQKTGKLGFTRTTAEVLKLSTEKCVKFYLDSSRPMEPVVVVLDEQDDDAFRVYKSSEYFSLNTTALFTKLGYDFKSNNIICDLVEDTEAAQFLNRDMVYRLISRQRQRKNKKEESVQQ